MDERKERKKGRRNNAEENEGEGIKRRNNKKAIKRRNNKEAIKRRNNIKAIKRRNNIKGNEKNGMKQKVIIKR